MPLIKLNATQGLTGALPAVSGASLTGVSAGKVLQVQTQELDTATSITGTSFADSGLTLAITPASSSNKVLVQFNFTLSGITNSYVAVKLFRGSTEIGSSSVSETGTECFAGIPIHDNDNSAYGAIPYLCEILDSPNTTSATTYKMQLSPMRSTSKSIYLNRSYHRGDSNQFNTTSRTILMEIEA